MKWWGRTCPVCTAELSWEKLSSPAFHFSNLKGGGEGERKGQCLRRKKTVMEEVIKKEKKMIFEVNIYETPSILY